MDLGVYAITLAIVIVLVLLGRLPINELGSQGVAIEVRRQH